MAQQQASISVGMVGGTGPCPVPLQEAFSAHSCRLTVGCQDLGGLGVKLQAWGEGEADSQ